jgi:hypothetical protein
VSLVVGTLFDINRHTDSLIVANIGTVALLGGFVSVVATRAAAVVVWLTRTRVASLQRIVGLVIFAVSVLGWLAFFGRFANPFFKG